MKLLAFNSELAEAHGVNGAIMVEHIKCGIMTESLEGENYHNGRYWMRASTKDFAERLPFWSEKQIKRILTALKDEGAVVACNYNKEPYDKTLWYTLAGMAV